MALVGFSNNGYDYFDEGRYILFTSNKMHNDLFNYVAKDLSQLPKLLEKYVSKKMDIATFKLNSYRYDNNDSAEIKDILVALHPYYKHEYREIIIKAIGNYFNNWLVYSSYTGQSFNRTKGKTWYLKRFTELASFFLREDDKYPEEFYAQYKEWVGANEHNIEENVIYNVPKEHHLQGFYDELQTQKVVKNMLYWILDISEPIISELTISQRIWLYGNMFYKAYGQYAMKVTKTLLFKPAIRYQSNHDYSQEVEYLHKIDDLFEPLYALSNIDVDCDGIPPEMLTDLNCVVEYAKTISKSNIYEEFEIINLHQLLYLEILSMIRDNISIKKCKHCGKYFVVTNQKIAYCDRIDDGENRCSAVGSKRSFQKKMEDEYPLKIYNRAYKTWHARVKHATITQPEFLKWCTEAKEKLNKVRAGELDISTFEAWLKRLPNKKHP